MAEARRPTIRDVARRADVSPGAVSLAVNGRPGVSAATRHRILAAAKELGWQPSARARALSVDRAGAVGLVVTREPDALEGDVFLMRFLAGAERALAPREQALTLQLLDGHGATPQVAYERLVAAGRVDGLLVVDVEVHDGRWRQLERLGVPAVVAGRPGPGCGLPWVESDHAAGFRRVVEHLLDLGHERIAFVGNPPRYEHVRSREEAWRSALHARGLPPGPVAYADDEEDRAARAATLAVLDADPPPTAIAYASDMLAVTGVGVAASRGLAVPRDLSVTGCDDFPLAVVATPALTTVRVDYRALGQAATEMVLALVRGDPAVAAQQPPAEVVVRDSTGPPPGRPLRTPPAALRG